MNSPRSDIYIAYDEMRLYDQSWLYPLGIYGNYDRPWLRNRQLAVKMTYLFSR